MESDFLSLSIEYKFCSDLGSRDADACITSCKAVLYEGTSAENSYNEYVGEIDFKVIYLWEAEAEGINIYDLFDTYEYTFRHGQQFYDIMNGVFKKPIINEFPDLEFGCNRICIIETIGIIPKFRGKGIGAKAFKDLVWHFSHCQLFVLQPYPLQFEQPENNEELFSKLHLDKLEKNEIIATNSLSNYYQSWGFKKIQGIKDLMFYCSMYRNEAFENINMDEY